MILGELEAFDVARIATFRLEYKDDYEYEFIVLGIRFRLAGRKLSMWCVRPVL